MCICKVLGASFVGGGLCFCLALFFFFFFFSYWPSAPLSLLPVDFGCAFLAPTFKKVLLFA